MEIIIYIVLIGIAKGIMALHYADRLPFKKNNYKININKFKGEKLWKFQLQEH